MEQEGVPRGKGGPMGWGIPTRDGGPQETAEPHHAWRAHRE